MNVFVCIAITINGLVTAAVPHDEWISEASWNMYLGRLTKTDVAIVGSKTYKVMDDEEFPLNLKYIVLTHHEEHLQPRDHVSFSQEDPVALIEQLKQEGYSSVGILGGSEVISAYLQAGVVKELFVDVESILSGKGKNLILPDLGIYKFELLDAQQLDAGSLQLHYKALRT